MKKCTWLFLLIISLSACVDEDSTSSLSKDLNYIYDISALPEVHLKVTVDEWNKLLQYYDLNPHNEECVVASMSFSKNGEVDVINNVGLRLRGNTSRRRPEGKKNELHNATDPDWHHASFSVDINRFIAGQRYAGLKKINLKWFKDDPLHAREIYCYDLFERFGVWTAPQSSYCRFYLHVSGDESYAYFGVYELLEAVDTEYLNERVQGFGDQQGFLWKANWGANFQTADQSKMGIEQVTHTENYEPVYDLKNRPLELDAARNQLSKFITDYNSKEGDDFKEWVTTRMDVPLFLKTYAVNVICGMWDDYWGNQNNFYFYFNNQGKFFFIPFDYDNTLGTSMIMNDSGTQDLLNWGDASRPLVTKLLQIDEFKALYIDYLHELCDPENDLFEAERSKARIHRWHTMIENHISNDTGEDMLIFDRPASWGNCYFYRLLDPVNNFFSIRAANLPEKMQ